MSKKIEVSDRLKGRPLLLNIQSLKNKAGKDYAEVVFFGDWHYGARECANDRALSMLNYCLEKETYIFLMGDLMEASTRYSVGDGVYNQLNPQKQMEYIVEKLKPLADKGLILGMLLGNHSNRIQKETGINVMKIMSKMLNAKYLGMAGWSLFKVGKQNYTIYSLHGATGSRFVYTKTKALVDISHSFDANLIAMGHVHEIADISQGVEYVDLRSKTLKTKKKFLVLTGHYLSYHNSYAQAKGFPLSKMGSPKVKFFSDKFDIHISS